MNESKNLIFGLLAILLIAGLGIIGFVLISNEDEPEGSAIIDGDTQPIGNDLEEGNESDRATISELIGNLDELSTLSTAVDAADLVETLSSEDSSYTIFAPTNDAFAEISSTVNPLLEAEDNTQLKNILTYHVIPNSVFSVDLEAGQEVETLNGQTIRFSIFEGEIYIEANGVNAKVTQPDIDASNGVVHLIDAVLLP